MRTVARVASGRTNNFDAIRFLAASVVIFGHAYPLSGRPSPFLLLSGGYDIGRLAVTVFFGISGLLIVKSYLRTPSLIDFAVARCARLLPGLAVALILTALVLGPAVSTLPAAEYFHRKAVYAYVARNLMLWDLRFTLPGVFEANPYPNAVNGSIWTLPWEVGCYISVVLVAKAGMLEARRIGIFLAAYAAAYIAFRGNWTQAQPAWEEFSLPFVIGGALYLWRKLPLNLPIFASLIGVTYLAWGGPFAREALMLAAVYGTFLVAAIPSTRLNNFGKYGDFSYGIYVYGFVVEQTVAFALPGLRPTSMAIITFACTLPLAVVSWRFVEKPAHDLRHRGGRWLNEQYRRVRPQTVGAAL